MGNNLTELNRRCRALPYSRTDRPDDEVLSGTAAGLRTLFTEFGAADVIGCLADVWPYEKAVSFFEKSGLIMHEPRSIRTIAASYFRACNGGAERVNTELMSLWISMGYDVVFFSDEPANSNDYPYPEAVKRIVVPSMDNIGERLRRLEESCREYDVDLFINHNWTDPRSLWETALMKTMGIACVQYCHSFFAGCFANGKTALYQTQAFRLSDLLIALSETNARFYQLCGCRSYLVQNPVSRELKDAAASDLQDTRRILVIGRISDEKNPMDALQIFKTVHDAVPDAVLDIVGSGDYGLLSCMREFVSANGLEGSVIFHGQRTTGELKEFYANAACVLMTSKMEGYPMVVIEAKAYGVPLVMYDLPYLTMLRDRKGFLSAPRGDKMTMAGNVIRILEDAKYGKKLGTEARESFESFAGYDIEAAWREVFSLCSGADKVSDAFYDPALLTEADRIIIPSLFEKIKEGYENTFTNSRDYRLGSFLLKVPRKIKALLKE